MGCGADTEANELIADLTADVSFETPTVNLDSSVFQLPGDETIAMYGQITRLTNADLTTGEINGSGSFDALMRGFKAHLKDEFERGRITGAEYSKAYTTLTQNAMSAGVQFLLGRDQAYWASQLAQLQAITGRLQLETAKMELIKVQTEALNTKANYALTKMKLASESMAYCIAKYNLENMLPKQLALVNEQIETQRSQTMDTRTDGVTPITGSVGTQKALYEQQITSYQRDAEVKAAKVFADAWTVQKTIDEGLLPPEGFENDNINQVLTAIMQNNNLGTMIID